jgi:YidC/Oxa1 family membrane protein insertase
MQAAEVATFGADNAPAKEVVLGSIERESGFKFQLELSTKGAAIRKAIFSEFDDRDFENPAPLEILSPVLLPDGGEILSMANREFVFVERKLQLPMGKLHWENFGIERGADGTESARFEAVIRDGEGEAVVKLVKSYKVSVGSYHLDCDLAVENLTDQGQEVRFNLGGPVGLGREGVRGDMRKAIGGFMDPKGKGADERVIVTERLKFDVKRLRAYGQYSERIERPGANFLWAAAANKYFAAILVPMPESDQDFVNWVMEARGSFYNLDRDERVESGDETVGVDLKVAPVKLAQAGEAGSSRTYNFLLYLGPKEKSLFDKNDLYRRLGFYHVIDFLACCCPAAIIHPLAFGILAAMKWMYGFIPNYGVVIIILVFVIRIVIHPLTKKSQVSMSKMSKLAPRIEEIKKRCANNKAEMNKQVMALYREQGASPVTGMLPMFVQMPIWIALYSAIYASVALRGAPFLPVWITDLSVPDALFRFKAVTLPIFGRLDSFNLLPILMGVAFYLQQKLMPHQAAAAASTQAAQQQKMMMVMMPILFPLMLYKAPSGLNLYIMSSVFAGVVEQYFIRKHIREKEEAESQGLVSVTSKTGGKVKKKKPKPFYKM